MVVGSTSAGDQCKKVIFKNVDLPVIYDERPHWRPRLSHTQITSKWPAGAWIAVPVCRSDWIITLLIILTCNAMYRLSLVIFTDSSYAFPTIFALSPAHWWKSRARAHGADWDVNKKASNCNTHATSNEGPRSKGMQVLKIQCWENWTES